ncbi:hypothetical protein [Flavobacterium sp.]|uniref:hypothetical protein n=1 Tax=Flavobacterium sp. TaxID=239 RepID=UPI0039E26D6D
MKNTFLIAFILLSSASCGKKEYFKEVISQKEVTLSLHEEDNEKYLTLNIPVEFELNFNSSKLISAIPYYKIDGKHLMIGTDYLMYNKVNNKLLWGFDSFAPYSYPKRIYFMTRKRKISEQQALTLIKKYNPNASLSSLQRRHHDTIDLIPYQKFRKDHPEFLQEMRKTPDSLIMNMWFGGNDKRVIKQKINW